MGGYIQSFWGAKLIHFSIPPNKFPSFNPFYPQTHTSHTFPPHATYIIIKGFSDKFHKAILHGRDAILRVRDKWLIFNMVLQLWADVKYHVPTGLVFRRRRVVFVFGHALGLSKAGGHEKSVEVHPLRTSTPTKPCNSVILVIFFSTVRAPCNC